MKKLLFLLLLLLQSPCYAADITFINAGTVVSDVTGAGSVTPTMPTHVTNDILIIAAMNDGGGTISTATSGWSQIAQVDGTNNMAWFWKRAPAAGTAGATITTADTDLFAVGFVIRGCTTNGTPYEDATTVGDGTTADMNPVGTTITTLGGDRYTVGIINVDDNTTFDTGPDIGWTTDATVGSAAGTHANFRWVSIQTPAPRDVSLGTFGSWATAERWGAIQLAFIPAKTGAEMMQMLGD